MIAPALWISAVVFVISLSIVLLITSYLIWQIFQSRRRVANTNKVIFSAAMSFMIINWMLTLHLIVAAVYSLITLTRFGRNITQSAFTVFNVIAAFLFLFQSSFAFCFVIHFVPDPHWVCLLVDGINDYQITSFFSLYSFDYRICSIPDLSASPNAPLRCTLSLCPSFRFFVFVSQLFAVWAQNGFGSEH